MESSSSRLTPDAPARHHLPPRETSSARNDLHLVKSLTKETRWEPPDLSVITNAHLHKLMEPILSRHYEHHQEIKQIPVRSYVLLVGTSTNSATLEICLKIPQKQKKNRSRGGPSQTIPR